MRRARAPLPMSAVVAAVLLSACSDGAPAHGGDGALPAETVAPDVSEILDSTAEASPGEVHAEMATPLDAASVPDSDSAPADFAVSGDDGATAAEVAYAPPETQPETFLADVPPDSPLTLGEKCFPVTTKQISDGPQYDQFNPKVASHCFGTDQQEIEGVEKVVFLGDSVTVGSPDLAHPLSIDNAHFWRNLFAEWMANYYGLDKGNFIDWGLWKSYDYVTGKGAKLESGDFKHCAKWGARTDDFIDGQNQIGECFPDGMSPYRTLIVFTMGGNDISNITQDGATATEEEVAEGYPKQWKDAEDTVAYLDGAVSWLKDPAHFPNGSYVIYASPFEFTDGTGDVGACPVAGIAGFGDWAEEKQLETMVVYILENYMKIAVDHQVDMIWAMEHFCGHGYVATGPGAGPDKGGCYLGPGTELWFDETCIHPNDAGHNAIFEMFQATVLE